MAEYNPRDLEPRWQRFWEDRGAKKVEIGYICEGKNEPDEAFSQRVREVAEHPKMAVWVVRRT